MPKTSDSKKTVKCGGYDPATKKPKVWWITAEESHRQTIASLSRNFDPETYEPLELKNWRLAQHETSSAPASVAVEGPAIPKEINLDGVSLTYFYVHFPDYTCQMSIPTLVDFAKQYDGVIPLKWVESMIEQRIAAKEQIRHFSTLRLYLHGQQVGELTGPITTKRLYEWLIGTLSQHQAQGKGADNR